jgi:hypothetical protein
MFQKIETTAQIKNYTRTEDGIKVAFKNMLFTDEARNALDWWMSGDKIEVRITVETYQDELPMKKENTIPGLTEEEEAVLDAADARRR